MKIVYVPIGVGTFHLESAQAMFSNTCSLLNRIEKEYEKTASGEVEIYAPDELLLTLDLLSGFMDKMNPDMVIIQNVTFANAAYATEICSRIGDDIPILLWTLREPVIDGTRLRLNSLTGAYSAANAMHAFRGDRFGYVFGAPSEREVFTQVKAYIKAAKLIYDLKHLKMAAIGHTPQGFGFGRALDLDMRTRFGVTLESIEVRELIERAKEYSDEDIKEYLEDAGKRICGLDAIDSKNVKDFARLYRAYKEYVSDNHYGAISSRCWPDLFTSFGTPVCAVLGILNDSGVASACEADSYGALSMYMGMNLSGTPVFFGDPVSMDEKENTITYWHCGMAPCSLAREDTGAAAGLHCNRKIGPTLDFGCKESSKATVFRLGRKADGSIRIFLLTGKALDKPKQFTGTSVVVECENSVSDIIHSSVKAGWEPHFVVIFEDIKEELCSYAQLMGIEVCEY